MKRTKRIGSFSRVKSACGVGAPTETEEEQFVSVVVLTDEPFISGDDFIVESVAEHAAAKRFAELCANACAVIHGLRKPVGAPRGTKGFQAPYVGTVVDGVPSAIKKERKSFLW
jgi:hypothetical protein